MNINYLMKIKKKNNPTKNFFFRIFLIKYYDTFKLYHKQFSSRERQSF